MKLRCVTDNLSKQELTYGEIYEFLGKIEDAQGILYYRVKNNAGRIVEYFADRFEIVDEVAPELELPEDFMDEIMGLELIKEDLEKEEVKGMRTLKERILAKVDYKAIAERIWDNIVDDVVDKVANNFDEDNIAEDFIYNYRSELIEQASEVIIEEFNEEISVSDIEDEIRDIARDLANE